MSTTEKRPPHRPRVYDGAGAPRLSLRLAPDILAQVKARGGAVWVRQLILEALAREDGQESIRA